MTDPLSVTIGCRSASGVLGWRSRTQMTSSTVAVRSGAGGQALELVEGFADALRQVLCGLGTDPRLETDLEDGDAGLGGQTGCQVRYTSSAKRFGYRAGEGGESEEFALWPTRVC